MSASMSHIIRILDKVNPSFARVAVQYVHKDDYFLAYTKNLQRILLDEHFVWAKANLTGLGMEEFLNRLNDDPYSSPSTFKAHEQALDQIYEAHLRI